MGNILTAKVRIVGVKPMLHHCFGPDAIPLEKLERSGVAGNDPEEFRKTVRVTKDGQLFIDATYIFAVIREGARNTKRGRGSIQPNVIATLQIVDSIILIDRYWPGFPNGQTFDIATAEPPMRDPEAPVYLDVRGVVNPSTKGRNVRYRVACSSGWSCDFSITWDKTIVSRNEMEASVIDGGRLSGIGSGRKIGMGRFEVASFEVTE